MRATPFGLVFADVAVERFPAIADVLARDAIMAADRDHFVLLEPVGRLLREIVPEEADADALEAHVLLLHHAYQHWVGGGWVYRIDDAAIERATAGKQIASLLPPPRPALYLQLPELRVWGTPTPEGAPEPLDGMFVSAAIQPGGIAVLGIFGMRPDRPGFSAVGLEGRADADDPGGGEMEVAAARADGSAPFDPMLAGGTKAGLYSLANAGELLLLTCRLLALLPSEHSIEAFAEVP
ncbi:MAG TPA: hypothetical protein VN908_00410 [Gemmatimonadales bacterium]|nr:hypothetical protein [Gemmatimonadales bacterium]